MSEETTMNEEMMMLLKALVTKVKELENAVFNKDNLLMKSGWVTVDSPTPMISNEEMPSGENIAKMEWSEISEMVTNLEGQQRGGY